MSTNAGIRSPYLRFSVKHDIYATKNCCMLVSLLTKKQRCLLIKVFAERITARI